MDDRFNRQLGTMKKTQDYNSNPVDGTFVIFTSETEHGVLPTSAGWYSVTGWTTNVPIGLTFL